MHEEWLNSEFKTYETVKQFVCAPLEIIGFARDPNGDDWRRVVEWSDAMTKMLEQKRDL